jgi:hypothetical protein
LLLGLPRLFHENGYFGPIFVTPAGTDTLKVKILLLGPKNLNKARI